MKLANVLILFSLVFFPSWAFQSDGNTKNYKASVDKLQKTLTSSVSSAIDVPLNRRGLPIDLPLDPGPPNYWFHPQIHTFGNHGPLGAFHATVAPLATKLIDVAAYEGENVRDAIAKDLRKRVGKDNARVVDFACGVGMSTRALCKAFGDADTIIGLDTSPEMIRMAKAYSDPKSFASVAMDMVTDMIFKVKNKKTAKAPKAEGEKTASLKKIDFMEANAEKTGLEANSFDLVTIMYCFHEAPYLGRTRILREAQRLLAPGGTLAVVDISPNYTPNFSMLAGEPYVLEYQENIRMQLNRCPGFTGCQYNELVPGHVSTWFLQCEDSMEI